MRSDLSYSSSVPIQLSGERREDGSVQEINTHLPYAPEQEQVAVSNWVCLTTSVRDDPSPLIHRAPPNPWEAVQLWKVVCEVEGFSDSLV